jgi:GntR family transcriptional regulator / MocR family aminotransferase
MTGPGIRRWDLNIPIEIDRESDIPLYKQLEKRIADEIFRGRLLPGVVLPGSRELAAQLKVNRKTVMLAYEGLASQGWVTSDPMRGTFVSAELPNIGSRVLSGTSRTVLSAPHYDLANEDDDVPIVLSGGPCGSFDDGLPDARIFPSQEFARAYRSALTQEAQLDRLYYGDPKGHPRLRQAIAGMLNAERGLSVGIDNVCVTRGSQMGIYLASRVLVRSGETVAIDELTYPPAFHAFMANEANVVAIRTDASGFDVDHLESECRKSRIKSIYLTPHHHFPTTVTLPTERRVRLLSIAEQYRFSIIEDDYDHDYNFDIKPLLPMAGFSPEKVVYIGSFSKILSPHLRLGYVVAAKETVSAIARQILLLDRQGDQVTELAVADFMESGELARHARRALNAYRGRRDAFSSILGQTFGHRVRFNKPAGGLAFWLEFGVEGDLNRIEHLIKLRQLRILRSDQYRYSVGARRGLRLGFASKTESEIVASLRVLHDAFSDLSDTSI